MGMFRQFRDAMKQSFGLMNSEMAAHQSLANYHVAVTKAKETATLTKATVDRVIREIGRANEPFAQPGYRKQADQYLAAAMRIEKHDRLKQGRLLKDHSAREGASRAAKHRLETVLSNLNQYRQLERLSAGALQAAKLDACEANRKTIETPYLKAARAIDSGACHAILKLSVTLAELNLDTLQEQAIQAGRDFPELASRLPGDIEAHQAIGRLISSLRDRVDGKIAMLHGAHDRYTNDLFLAQAHLKLAREQIEGWTLEVRHIRASTTPAMTSTPLTMTSMPMALSA